MVKRKLITLEFDPVLKPGPETIVFGEQELKLTEHLAACLNLGQVADYFGISEKTFHNIRDRQPEVDQAYKRGRAKAVNGVGRSLISRALDGEPKAMQFYLSTQGGWKKTETVEHISPDRSMSPAVDYSKLSKETLRELMNAAAEPGSSGD